MRWWTAVHDVRRAAPERGSGLLQWLSLGVLAAVVLGGLVTLGLPGTVGSGVRAVVCRVTGGGTACAADAAAGGTPPADGTPRGGRPARNGWCHGVWDCTWKGAGHFFQGFGGGAKDFGSGIAGLVTGAWNDPVGTGTGLVKFGWSKSGGQYPKAWKTCTSGKLSDAQGCGSSLTCIITGPGCLISDSVLDPKVKQDAENGRGAHGFGRMTFNIMSWLVPMKVPKGLGAAKGAGEAGDVGTASKAARTVDDTLTNARKARDAAHAGKLPWQAVEDLAAYFHRLTPAERTAFLDKLTVYEFGQLYREARTWELSEIIQALSPSALKRFRPNPRGWKHGTDYGPLPNNGRVFNANGPHPADISQGVLGNCWCLAPMGALARQSPQLIRTMIRRNPNGTFTVKFGDNGEVTVTDDFPRTGASTASAGWPAILEKALAERNGGYDAVDPGGRPSTAFRQLTGKTPEVAGQPGYRKVVDTFRRGDPAVIAISEDAKIPGGAAKRGIVTKHGYTVVDVDHPKGTVTLANPHGPHKGLVTLNRRDLRAKGVTLVSVPAR